VLCVLVGGGGVGWGGGWGGGVRGGAAPCLTHLFLECPPWVAISLYPTLELQGGMWLQVGLTPNCIVVLSVCYESMCRVS